MATDNYMAAKNHATTIAVNTVILGVCPVVFLAVAVILRRTIYTKSAEWSFSDANLALKLTAAYDAMRLRLGLVYNSTYDFSSEFFARLLGTQRTAQFALLRLQQIHACCTG